MSLARAFTTKRTKQSQTSALTPQRSLTTKGTYFSGPIRHKISAPLELVSTTNMLSYNAPDIFPGNSSGDESDTVPSLTHSPGGSTNGATPSMDSDPTSPEPNHLSCYFEKSARHSNSSTEGAPIIPKRALSHTKRSHEALHRQRSISRSSGQRISKTSAVSVIRDSIQMFSAQPEAASEPFGNELAQVNELAEDFGGHAVHFVTEEERELASRGFFKFGAQDYLSEIEPLYQYAFGTSTTSTMWI